jgi:DNA-binding NtrC family response regulator
MNRKVLLVDGDESVRRMVARVLDSVGYDVLLADTGRPALEAFSSEHPDLVVVDLKAPGEGGWRDFDAIRKLDPHVPVVATTTWPNQYESAVQRGISALLEKPLDLPLLLDVIRGLLSERGQLRQSA